MRTILLAGAATALLTGAASAADLPRRAPPPVFTAVPVFTWTGFYAGLESTYAFTDKERVTTEGISAVNITNVTNGTRAASLGVRQHGFANIGGGFGYNYQFTPGSGFVIGLANNIDWTDLVKQRGYLSTNGNGFFSNTRQSTNWLGTLTGKVGYAWDRFLVYGTGGLAYGQIENRNDFYSNVGTLLFSGGNVTFETGYAYGGGIEYAIPETSFLNTFSVARLLGINAAATIKAEYLHYDLGNKTVFIANTGAGAGTGYLSHYRNEGNLVRVGFNYKFGG